MLLRLNLPAKIVFFLLNKKRSTMKKILLTALCVLPMLSFSAFAGIESCDSEDVHCSYVTGDIPCPNDGDECKKGKYIKLSQAGFSQVVCLTEWSAISIPQDDVEEFYHDGQKVTHSFSQCLDKACTASQFIGDDTFVIKKEEQSYTSTPKYYDIKVSADYGQDCEVGVHHPRIQKLHIKQ